jgi:GMP synthase-like glutamine amidotransferase
MRWSCLQHVPFEGPAYLGTWARARGHALTRVEVWTGASLPPPDESDGVFVLGGPMNVYEEDRHPWLAAEKRFLAEAIAAGKPMLGVCLGAQLISLVLGGSVTKNPHGEIGWFPVRLTPAGREAGLFSGFPDEFTAFHWHGDRFSIPEGAIHAARSEACEQQAFVYEGRVVGLQFHLESTRESIEALTRHCGDEITRAPYVQAPAAMLEQASHLPATHALVDRLLDRLVLDGS